MNKKILALVVLFASLVFLGISCSKGDEDEVDEDWKAYNEELFRKVVADRSYKARSSLSGNGAVYWKNTDFFDKKDGKDVRTPKITESGNPYTTDSIVVRYEGWFFLQDSTKIVFDSTEDEANAQAGRGMRITAMNADGTISGVVDGWITMLTNMRVGDAVEVCIPQQLGYGAMGKYTSAGIQTIPGYTTLWFNIKLLKIIPDNPGEFD